MKKAKLWGTTELLVKTETTELHRIEIDKDGESSYHYHEHKYNLVYVESGKLLINHEDTTPTILTPGKRVVLAPGEKHSFKALEPTIAYEFYWVLNHTDDIIRLS